MSDQYGFGRRFGRGVVTDSDIGRDRSGHRRVRLLCHPHEGGCGTVYEAVTSNLRSGRIRSCGCLRAEQGGAKDGNTIHGLHGHPLYPVWQAMTARCENPANDRYHRYGGRVPPITVWEPWHDPARFIADIEAEIGPRPPGRTPGGMPLWTINRKDNDGNYVPGNVEWADGFTQARNRVTWDRRAAALLGIRRRRERGTT